MSPLSALCWELWHRGHRFARPALGCLCFAAFINLATPQRLRTSDAGLELFPALFGALMVLSFLLTMGIFNYTEFDSSKEWNGFPYRLFVMPLPTWQLVMLPMLLGVVSVELAYWAWIKLVWTHSEVLMPEWFAVLLGAYMIFYQAVLWSFAGFRITRILILSIGGASSIGVACLPFFSKLVPSPWLAEKPLIIIICGFASLAFVGAWAAVARQRCGGGRRQSWLKTKLECFMDVLPRRSTQFTSAAAAQFWFEWRRTGLLLPACALFALFGFIAPLSWLYRHDPRSTMETLLRALATPIVLAFPIGKGFIKPEFWATDLALAPFLAVRPLPAGEFVIAKMKVAALSVAITWLFILGFIALWLPLRADTTQLDRLLLEFRSFYPHSWQSITVLYLAGFVVITWRCLVSGLWVGLSGNRSYFVGSLCLQVLVPLLPLLAAGLASEQIDSLIRVHPDLVKTGLLLFIGWSLALLVSLKVWFAAFSWRKIAPHRTRQYLLLWSCVTLCFVILGIISRPWADIYRQEHLYVLAAFLLFPLARLGLAPPALSKNRHR